MSAAQLGADVVINSVHKTLPCLTQTGVIHLCSDRVSREKLKRFSGNLSEQQSFLYSYEQH